MKKFRLLVMTLFFGATCMAQAPQKMSYQMVIRNSSNVPIANQQVGIRVSILQGSATGTTVFSETQTATTNTNGLVSIAIGTGTTLSGSFGSINWGNGPYFLKTETDPNGGTNYSITATSELLSVPYALYAGNAASKGKTYFVLEDSVSNSEAAARAAEDLGEETQFIWIKNTKLLTSINLSKATRLLELIISGNADLTQVTLPDVKFVHSVFTVDHNPALASFSCPQLQSISTSGANSWVSFTFNRSLTTVSLPALEKISPVGINFSYNASIQTLTFPALRTVDGDLAIGADSVLQTLTLPSLTTAARLSVASNRLTNLTLPVLSTVANIYVTQQNAPLAVSFPQVQNVSTLYISSNVTSLNVPVLATAAAISIQNTSITNLSFPQLSFDSSTFTITGNPQLQTVSAAALMSVGNTLQITSNANLQTVTLTSLQTVANTLQITTNVNLQTLTLSSFQTIATQLSIYENKLNAIDLPAFTGYPTGPLWGGPSITIWQTSQPVSISMPLLTSANVLSIGAAPNNQFSPITALDLSSIISVGTLTVQNTAITTLQFPQPVRLGTVHVNGNTSLTSVNIQNAIGLGYDGTGLYLMAYGTPIDFYNNALTTTTINALLAKMVSLNVKYRGNIDLRQNPPAPPTGQGLIDFATLRAVNVIAVN